MRLYKVYAEFDENEDVVWKVHEKTTDQTVAECWFEDDALEYATFLECGGAFAGFTPTFIIKKTQSGDINAAFAAEFVE